MVKGLALASIAALLIASRVAAQNAFSTEQFLKLCQSDSDWCKEHVISLVSVHNAADAIHPDKAQSCPPRNVAAKGEEITDKILGWLKAHPEAQGKTDGESIETALKALYPCDKK
ncbi:MAG: Rap1a/Tai family immunity protein [Alphaproteobacteria bacterium]